MTHFSLQFLGTGNAQAKPPVNYNNNVLVQSGSHKWLIDCGHLCPLALYNLGIPLTSIDGAYISHLHGDHVMGLEELLFSNYFHKPSRTVDLFLPCGLRTQTGAPKGYDIWENCLRAGLETTVSSNHKDRTLSFEDYASIHTLHPQKPFNIFGVSCEIFQVTHIRNRPSYGIILDNRTAFTSDCIFSREIIQNLIDRGIETIFHDASFAPPQENPVHASFEELSTLSPDMARHIVLMHYEDNIPEAVFDKARALGFLIAKPGMVFNFQ